MIMKITIISVGKLKEKYLLKGTKEYSKRLSKYTKLEFIEVSDELVPETFSDKVKDGFIISLVIEGEHLSSVEFANKFEEIKTYKSSHITFIIGGSNGLSNEVINKSDYKLSFSSLTFPHQLMRLILIEQVYRPFRILNNELNH